MNSRRFIGLTQTQEPPDYIRSLPCIAAKAACSRPLWVKGCTINRGDRCSYVRFAFQS